MKQLLRGCFQNITRKHPGGVLAVGLILSGLSIWTATGLRYDSRMDNLLPEDLPLAREFRQVVEKTGGSTPLVVVLEGLNQTRAPQVLKDLSERLAKLDGARFVDWQIPKKFLENRQLLLASRQDLIRLERIMEDAVDYSRSQFAGLFGGPEPYNPADLQSLAQEYKIFEPINPFYKGKSQSRYYLFVQPQGAGTNTEFIRPFIEAVKTEIGDSGWEENLPGLKINLTGSMMPRIEESDTILSDLTKAAGLAVFLATSVIVIYTRSGFSIPLILIPLLVSLTYTLALTRCFIGHVNIISGFLVAILMGLGIDYGIHLYIRFKQELLKGKSIVQAVELVITQVGRSGTVAMLTTMGVFSLLMTSEFRGFSEFGQIASIGIFCAFISYYFLFPAQALLLDKIHWLRKPRPRLFSLKLGGLYTNTPYFLATLFFLLMVSSLFLVPEIEFEYDFQKLKGESPATEYEKKTTEDFGFAFSPTVVVAASPKDLFPIHQALDRVRQKYGDKTTIGMHHSLGLFGREEYAAKKDILGRIQNLMNREADVIEISLGTHRFQKLKALVEASPFDEDRIPEVLKQRFMAGEEYLLLVYAKADKDFFDVRNIYQLEDEIQDLKQILAAQGIEVLVMNENLLAAAIMDWVVEKGPWALAMAMGLVFIILLVDLHSFKLALQTFLPLLTGLALTGALMSLFHIKLNFINIVMLPSIVGLMIDHCIYLGHHMLDYPSSDALKSVRETGSAILLSALTSLAGYISLNVAHHAGIRSIASMVEIGIITCTACALFMMPALYALKNYKLRMVRARKDLKLKTEGADRR